MNEFGQTSAKIPSRRHLLQGSLALAVTGLGFTLIPITAAATPVKMRGAISEVFGDRPIQAGKVALKLPQLAETGASVQITIDVDSPADQTDYVKSIHIFSEKNPLPDIGRFYLSPGCGRASVTTRIRLANSQTIVAIATLSDDSLWSGSAQSIVTLAACVDSI